MHLVKPTGKNRQYVPRFRNWDGKQVCVPGHRQKNIAARRLERCMMLVDAKLNGDSPPAEFAKWLANMDDKLYARLVKLGLIDRRRREQV